MKTKRTKENEHEEQLSILESDILSVLCNEPFVNQRILAETSGHSLGVVNRSLRSLIASGYLDEQVQLTPKAVRMFKARAPRNAIILAAGFGMRMVPINLTTPNAFLEVNGEKLIERTIRQLKEAGVQDITVVVGFMKDSFEYLIDEYGVDLVYIHFNLSIFSSSIIAATFSVAAGSMRHSASRITLICSDSGVSPSQTLTAFCIIISPPSGISLT